MILFEADYSKEYFPSKDAIAFYAWLKTFFDEPNKTPPVHLTLMDHLNSKHRHKVVECFRGFAKSTLMRYSVLYWLHKGKKPNFGEFQYILLVQDNVSMAASTIDTLSYLIENSDLNKYLEVRKKTLGDDPTLYVYNRELDKEFFIKGRGSGQSMRGINIRGVRPQIMIFDDIENDEKHGSKETRMKLKAWFRNVAMPAVDENRHEYIVIGTPIHEDSLLVSLLGSKLWKAIVLPICNNFSLEEPDKIVPAWEDRMPSEKIIEKYEAMSFDGDKKGFYQEYLLEVTPSDDMLYEMDRINWYETEDLRHNLSQMTYYVSVDLAVSEKSYADYTAISVIGVNDNNDWFLVDGFFGRVKPDETIDKIFLMVERWKPYTVVLEKVAFQLSMKTFLQNEMVKRGRFFSIDMVSRTKSKLAVLKGLQPIVELGRFWLPKDRMKGFVEELTHEMESITNDSILCKHDDLIDSIAQLTLIETISAHSNVDYGYEKEALEPAGNPYIF